VEFLDQRAEAGGKKVVVNDFIQEALEEYLGVSP
jgi:hypothetical protein